ncbi:hypothetical protein M9Y10_031876, partial [Tritrichomonas musculus]
DGAFVCSNSGNNNTDYESIYVKDDVIVDGDMILGGISIKSQLVNHEERIAAVENKDMTIYAKKDEIPDLTPYVKKDEIVTVDLSPYVLKTELAEDHYTAAQVEEKFVDEDELAYEFNKYETKEVAEEKYALKTDIPTVDLTPYALKTELPTIIKSQHDTTNDVAVPTVKLVEDKLLAYDQEKNEIYNRKDCTLAIKAVFEDGTSTSFTVSHNVSINDKEVYVKIDDTADYVAYESDKVGYIKCNVESETTILFVKTITKNVFTYGDYTYDVSNGRITTLETVAKLTKFIPSIVYNDKVVKFGKIQLNANCPSSISVATDFNGRDITSLYSFGNLSKTVIHIDFTNFDISNVTICSDFANKCNNLETIKFDKRYSNNLCKYFDWMFIECRKLKEVDLSMFYSRNVEKIGSIFMACIVLEVIDISNLIITAMSQSCTSMFEACRNLKILYIHDSMYDLISYAFEYHSSVKLVKSTYKGRECYIPENYLEEVRNSDCALKSDIPNVDLEPYALKTDIPTVDLEPYALKSALDLIKTNVINIDFDKMTPIEIQVKNEKYYLKNIDDNMIVDTTNFYIDATNADGTKKYKGLSTSSECIRQGVCYKVISDSFDPFWLTYYTNNTFNIYDELYEPTSLKVKEFYIGNEPASESKTVYSTKIIDHELTKKVDYNPHDPVVYESMLKEYVKTTGQVLLRSPEEYGLSLFPVDANEETTMSFLIGKDANSCGKINYQIREKMFTMGLINLTAPFLVNTFNSTSGTTLTEIYGNLTVTGKVTSANSTTITHLAPIEAGEEISDFKVGKPVFMSGHVYKRERVSPRDEAVFGFHHQQQTVLIVYVL